MRLPRLLIIFGIFFISHYYIWARLVRDAELPQPWFALATAVAVLLCVGAPVLMLTTRHRRRPAARLIMAANYTWMGMFFIFLWLLAGLDLLHLMWWLAQKAGAVPDAPATVDMLRVAAEAVVAIAAGLGLYSMYAALGGPVVKPVTVQLRRWPKNLDGLKIVQISDLHVAPLLGREYVQKVVDRTNAQQPDVICITGDMVDGTPDQLREKAAPLANLQARLGVFWITGNHEFYWDAEGWVEEARRMGMKPLRAERCTLGEGADSFDMAGIDDITAGRPDDIARTMQGRDPTKAVILLAHQPKVIDDAVAQDVDLVLSGHTHGGQIWPFGYLVLLAQPFLVGLGRRGTTQIYVNRGTGYWGPPMRLGGRPELTLLNIRHG